MENAPTLVAFGRLPSNADGRSAANSHARKMSMISGVPELANMTCPFDPFVLKWNRLITRLKRK